MTWTSCASVAEFFNANHYLGAAKRGVVWQDQYGALVVFSPTARHIPSSWLELTRWCLIGVPNGGSRQWASFVRALREQTEATTIVSYSDPAQGHTGSLYRACNWWWHRLRPPPTGNGSWDGNKSQSVKDRWVFPLRPDSERVDCLRIKDESVLRRWPWAEYREPGGANFKRFQEINV